MKFKTNFLFILLATVFLFWNCSSEDDSAEIVDEDPTDENPIDETPINYFPLVIANEWQYENTEMANGETQNTSETLEVASQSETENGTTFMFNSTSNEATLSFTNILSNGEVYKNGNQLLLTGDFNIGIDQTEIPDLNIDFEDLVVYDKEAVNGSIMFTDDRNFDLPEFNDITLSLSLSIESSSLGNLESLDVNGVTFENVIGSEFKVSLGIDASAIVEPFPFPISVEVLEFQEVVLSTNYFANGVGLIQSETNLTVNFSEELNQIPNFNLEDIMAVIEQKLLTYQVTLEE